MRLENIVRIVRSLWYDRWINLAVLLGVACAAAVLTGALLVGDSMRGSLRDLTLDRLGRIDTILLGNSFFHEPQIAFEPESDNPWTNSFSGILLSAAIEFNGKICPTQILAESSSTSTKRGQADGMTVNRTLADRLGLKVGDTVSLRLNSPQPIPSESSLGRKDDLLIRSRIKIGDVLPNEGLGRFSLKADQQAEPLLLAPLDWLQKRLGVEGKVNAVFFETESPSTVSTPRQRDNLQRRFKPSPGDLGMVVMEKDDRAYIKSDRMMFSERQAEEIQAALPDAEPGLLYLATLIKALKNNRETPYSTVYACDLTQQADKKPDVQRNGTSGPDEQSPIALNQWTVDDLEVDLGDEIELTWFSPDNANETRSQTFLLTKILPMEGIGADPHTVPDVKGLTDENTISQWDPPFSFDAKRIRQKDEDYWDRYRAAPKALVPLDVGRKLWGSRFGDTTTFIVEHRKIDENRLAAALNPSTFGLNFMPVKAQGLAASSGTTPFSVLFLSFSFFIIASALMLVLMLFRLAVEMKARQIGIRLTVGWSSRQVARLFLAEGFAIALTGSLIGTLLGILYAKTMIYGLTTWWVDAVTVPFLKLHVTPWSLSIGFLSGVAMALATIVWSLRIVRKIPVKTLLSGHFELPPKAGTTAPYPMQSGNAQDITGKSSKSWSPVEWIVVVAILFTLISLANQPVFFFCTGIIVLLFGVWQLHARLTDRIRSDRSFTDLTGLVASNTARRRGRSLLFIGLVASTTFLVLSIGAFRLDPIKEASFPASSWQQKNGGFSYIAETAFPVYHDLDTATGRAELGVQLPDEKHLEKKMFRALPFRMRGGDNASCLNLYQSNTPRILGVPERISEHGRFLFAKSPHNEKTWDALRRPLSTDPDGVRRVPIILDANTAMYSLHLYKGLGETYELDLGDGKNLRCEVVGLLSNSVLQGDILMGEENFQSLFPDSGGYRLFLFRCGIRRHPFWYVDDATVKILYDTLGDYGFQGETTADRLRKLFAVQNTYLSTFQSLGGIGLLLGMFGLAVIQFRNVFERRREIALMQAVGFSKGRIIQLLFYENLSLLFKGLGLAVFASFFALLPFLLGWATQQTTSLQSLLSLFAWLVGGMLLVGAASSFLASRGILRIPVARELAEEH